MSSETVDPIDWLQPPPYTGQYPLSSTYAHCNAGWAANHETYCTEWGANLRPSDYQTNALPVRPLRVSAKALGHYPNNILLRSQPYPKKIVQSMELCAKAGLNFDGWSFCQSKDYFSLRKINVPFSIAIGNWELMHKSFPKHSRMETYEEGKKRGMSMERTKVGTKKKVPMAIKKNIACSNKCAALVKLYPKILAWFNKCTAILDLYRFCIDFCKIWNRNGKRYSSKVSIFSGLRGPTVIYPSDMSI